MPPEVSSPALLLLLASGVSGQSLQPLNRVPASGLLLPFLSVCFQANHLPKCKSGVLPPQCWRGLESAVEVTSLCSSPSPAPATRGWDRRLLGCPFPADLAAPPSLSLGQRVLPPRCSVLWHGSAFPGCSQAGLCTCLWAP